MAQPAQTMRRSLRVALAPLHVLALVLTAALATWLVTLDRMQGMDAGPGTSLGRLGWFLGIWVTMMAAMMLPSAAPMALLFARTARGRTLPLVCFLAGYLAAWSLYGLAAYAAYRAIDSLELGFLAWNRGGPYVAGGAVIAAGLYELTPLKSVCLRHCRSPFHFLLHRWRRGPVGALRMGVEHGGYCVGCCFGLMLILFAVGVMSLFWMAVIAAAIFVQKVLPLGTKGTWLFAAAFVAFGIWIAADPGSVPHLTEPGGAATTMMTDGM
jgi:predicted metal-binding membrane protein